MSVFVLGAILLGLSGGFAILWKRKIEDVFGFSALLTVAVLYVAGLLGQLVWGVYAVVVLAGIGVLFCLVCLFTNFKDTLARLFTPGLIGFLITLCWVLVVFRNRQADNYGSFSHWGLEIKNLYLFDAIPNGLKESTIYFRHYPPGSALFQYFAVKLAGALNEGEMFRALGIFMVSLLLPVFSSLSWKDWKGIIPLWLSVFAIPLLFNTQAYTTLGIDSLLGCVAAYIVIIGHAPKRRAGDGIIIGMALFVLPSIKVSGLAIAILALLMLAVDWLANRRFERAWKTLAVIAGLLLCALVSKWSWDLYISRFSTILVSADLSSDRIRSVFQSGLEPYQLTSLRTFLTKMIDPNGAWRDFAGHTYLFWVIAFSVIGIVVTSREEKGERSRPIVVMTIIGAVVYALSLLATYWFKFSQMEAERVNECERYFSTYLILMFAVLLYILVRKCRRMENGFSGKLTVMAMCLLLFVSPIRLYANTVGYYDFIRGAELNRALMRPSTQVMESLDSKEHRVYFLSQAPNDYAYWVVRYEMSPVQLSELYQGVQLAKDGETAGGVESPQAWLAQLAQQGFTHLYLYQVDDVFCQDFGVLFQEADKMQDGSLFAINKDGNGYSLIFCAQ